MSENIGDKVNELAQGAAYENERKDTTQYVLSSAIRDSGALVSGRHYTLEDAYKLHAVVRKYLGD